MITSRHEDTDTMEVEAAHDHPHAGERNSPLQSTKNILKTIHSSDPSSALNSFIVVESELRQIDPPATLSETDLRHSKESNEVIKSSLGIKSSSHPIEVVQFNDGGCDLVFSLPFTNSTDLNLLPGRGKACYIITSDNKIFYAHKVLKILTPVPVTTKVFDAIWDTLSLNPTEESKDVRFFSLMENLSSQQLQEITLHTGHKHGIGFYKHNHIDSVMSQLEAANSIAYQLLGSRYFPTCYAVRNSEHHYVGVLSNLLPGFTPNRDRPLRHEELEIASLKYLIKKRDEHDLQKLAQIFEMIGKIVPLLKREVDPKNSFFYRAYEFTKNTHQYYLGDAHSAQHVRPILEEFIKNNPPTITFGKLELIRQVLIKRRLNIEQTKARYIAKQHDHDIELPLINKTIEQLNLILLDDIALFMKHLRRINKELQDAWVDVEAERKDKKSKYANIQISEGLISPLHVSLEDICHYRIHTGQAIGLTSRLFMQDPDGHSKNMDSTGRNVDGDLAVYPLTYRFKKSGRKPNPNDYVLNVDDYINFPNISVANLRYWATKAAILDSSADAALSSVSDVTKNYFTPQDNQNYQTLEKSPVFNFQKYVQLIIFSLTNSQMFTACSKLHLTDQMPMLNDDGDALLPLPLRNESGKRQDLQYKWAECMTNRALEARTELALHLRPVQMILARHGNLVLEMVLDHFKQFMEDRSAELNVESMRLLEEVIHPALITKEFSQLSDEILSSMPVNNAETDSSMIMSMNNN